MDRGLLAGLAVFALLPGLALAQQSSTAGATLTDGYFDPPQPVSLGDMDTHKTEPAKEVPKHRDTDMSEKAPAPMSLSGFRGVSEFFNIREANPNVATGEWEFQVPMGWTTRSDAGDDDFALATALKYGITDDLFLGLEVLPLNLGDGRDQGNGDLGLIAHWRIVRETDAMPAFATWMRMRVPTGQGSSGVDGEFHGTLSKSIADRLRVHLDGFVMTANGERGEQFDNNEDRRHFQWGVGPGLDYELCESTLLVMNYLHRNSFNYGAANQNILEFGVNQKLFGSHTLKAAIDVGLDDNEDTANFAAKLQWGFTFK